MPQTFYTEEEVAVYTRQLARTYSVIQYGAASDIEKKVVLKEIEVMLGWKPSRNPAANAGG